MRPGRIPFLFTMDEEIDADLLEIIRVFARANRASGEVRRLLRLGIQADPKLRDLVETYREPVAPQPGDPTEA